MKSRAAKVRGCGASWPDERWKIAPRCGAKHISKSKCTNTHQVRTTFGSWDVEKVHSRCGAKHISKSKCTKHQGFGPLLEVEMSKKCTPLWREAHFQVKMYKTPGVRTHFWKLRCRKSARRCGAKHISKWRMKEETPQCRTTFGSCDVEKVHAVVARSTFPSQNVQSTPFSDHFLKFRCRKSARRCGAKHISKSKCTKHLSVGRLLEVEMSKKCTPLWREAHFEVKILLQNTPFSDHFWKLRCRKSARRLWREAHFQVKSVKNWRSRTTFGGSDVEKVSKKCTPLWREAHFRSQKCKKLRVLSLFWREDVEKVDTD